MSNKIKAYRTEHGISQEALAEAMEVTRQTIISLEKKKYTASLNLAYKLAQYFNTTIEDIFFDSKSDKEEKV
ncbi:MAG: helix-turn-helix transcriptional regulator [Lactococcus sp.]|uniref:Helix-turn-helix transcriptional regulator n=1 Tax=Pseudolactococcus piscium MKFS47 TaxID=297352 RepID=A0A0D6DX17_9LACT|nr:MULTISPECIES: helix-turn-helix transcriptional regulator [Lactococcus]MDN6205995.1 helix-turn-helix transcriptional regulator [Staphylococcus simulans]MCJ1971300.1 helix-turn-helix transcriptional regulator [Lactococcus carnosus]MDN5402928.1 helix-turn-helix transcriptional regulator [Lactococcus sp.]MDN5408846.1 helix-turn-helix transcriptional regulator [Lactococcus sp.]MDN5412070.1 helix-turn-helix transcriptional regulator [Lactococcus sp.]